MLNDILRFNKEFVKNREYEKYITNKYPEKKVAIVTCMDTRLIELLPAALGFKNGDIKIIKNAGGIISHPFGSALRSLLIAIYELGVNEVMIIGHTDCGAQQLHSSSIIGHMKERGITEDSFKMLKYCGVNLDNWLDGFKDLESSVRNSVDMVRSHPFVPKDVSVNGFIINSITGELTPVEEVLPE